ncbi:hypothetical protein BaRGS_00033598 [Batillaria attramentaria]|uniref:Uncharacterized protein n=1 Tax=Batillaria attramentaria TaxID=370345 RepID=A0ABD0JJR8_9CAEN
MHPYFAGLQTSSPLPMFPIVSSRCNFCAVCKLVNSTKNAGFPISFVSKYQSQDGCYGLGLRDGSIIDTGKAMLARNACLTFRDDQFAWGLFTDNCPYLQSRRLGCCCSHTDKQKITPIR